MLVCTLVGTDRAGAAGEDYPRQAGAHPGALAEILGAARQAFSFTSDGDQEWIFGKTAMALYPALAAR
jgi:hypothetical protein